MKKNVIFSIFASPDNTNFSLADYDLNYQSFSVYCSNDIKVVKTFCCNPHTFNLTILLKRFFFQFRKNMAISHFKRLFPFTTNSISSPNIYRIAFRSFYLAPSRDFLSTRHQDSLNEPSEALFTFCGNTTPFHFANAQKGERARRYLQPLIENSFWGTSKVSLRLNYVNFEV